MSVEPATPSSELLFEALPQAAGVYDRETRRVLAVNDALAKTFGYAPAELVGLAVGDVFAAEELLALSQHLDAGIAGDRASCWTMRHRDGQTLRVEIRARDIVYAGRPATLVVALDISELTDLERALRESEDLYRTVVSTISDGVWVTARCSSTTARRRCSATRSRSCSAALRPTSCTRSTRPPHAPARPTGGAA